MRQQELNEMFEQLDHEVDLLYQALEKRGAELEENYAEKIARSELENIGEVIEAMSQHLGNGEKISVTTPSQLEGSDNNETNGDV